MLKNLLILSDTKKGHENQSIAFAQLLNADYRIITVGFYKKWFKWLSYLFDYLGIYTDKLVHLPTINHQFDAIVSTGSNTYYANKVLSKKYHCPSIVLMYPAAYKLNFNWIFAQQHDSPPVKKNIIPIPVNFNYPVQQHLFKAQKEKKYIGFIIGGSNKIFSMDPVQIKSYLDQVFKQFQHSHDFVITTSPRTPPEIELLIESYPFNYRLFFSREKKNPIADFIHQCDYLFITQDSTSMISEAVCYGQSCVEVLPLNSDTQNTKYHRLCSYLEQNHHLHIFNGTIGQYNKKINLTQYLKNFL